jgi:hypothetical protein
MRDNKWVRLLAYVTGLVNQGAVRLTRHAIPAIGRNAVVLRRAALAAADT